MTLSTEERDSMIKHYMQKSDKSLKTALLLSGTDDYDAAANRAYYAIFQAEKALLLTKGISGDSHKHVHTHISKEFVKSGELSADTYQKISRIQAIRTIGDYSGTESVSEKGMKESISEAKKFLEVTKELVEKFLMEQNNRLSEEDIRQNRLAAISSAKEVMGDRIFVTNATNGEYSGEIIAKTDVYAIQRITDNQAVLHELTDLPGGIDIEIGEKITLHRNEGKTVLSVQDNSIEEGQER